MDPYSPYYLHQGEVIDQIIRFKRINDQWKITEVRRFSYYGSVDNLEPEPYVRLYTKYIIDPTFARVEVKAAKETKLPDYVLPPEAVQMSKLKSVILSDMQNKK